MATYLETARDLLGVDEDQLSDTVIFSGFAANGINPADEYVESKASDIALANFMLWLSIRAKRISEGGYTVEIDAAALLQVRSLLLRKWGLDDGQGPRLRNKSWLW